MFFSVLIFYSIHLTRACYISDSPFQLVMTSQWLEVEWEEVQSFPLDFAMENVVKELPQLLTCSYATLLWETHF